MTMVGQENRNKVVVGMSGGVDSAVAAYLLKEAGYEVFGVTLRTWLAENGSEGRCCEIDDARSTAGKLGIQFLPVNCLGDFQRFVVDPFTREYLRGRTPNPCIECNRHIKWEKLLYYAGVVGAGQIATGHYAVVKKLENGRYTLQTAKHAQKDQTYMLYRLTQEQLAKTLMPLGGLSKGEVRQIAKDAGLPVASKPDSQEVCFVTDGSYADYIGKSAGEELPGEGYFVDPSGNKLGRHKGIVHYTVGQRRGLGVALGSPAYVREIRPETNEVVLGDERSLYRRELLCENVSFMGISGLREGESLPCTARIRYRHAPQPAQIAIGEGGTVKVTFSEPVRAPAPGQSAVFYDEEGCVIGGGVISEVR